MRNFVFNTHSVKNREKQVTKRSVLQITWKSLMRTRKLTYTMTMIHSFNLFAAFISVYRPLQLYSDQCDRYCYEAGHNLVIHNPKISRRRPNERPSEPSIDSSRMAKRGSTCLGARLQDCPAAHCTPILSISSTAFVLSENSLWIRLMQTGNTLLTIPFHEAVAYIDFSIRAGWSCC